MMRCETQVVTRSMSSSSSSSTGWSGQNGLITHGNMRTNVRSADAGGNGGFGRGKHAGAIVGWLRDGTHGSGGVWLGSHGGDLHVYETRLCRRQDIWLVSAAQDVTSSHGWVTTTQERLLHIWCVIGITRIPISFATPSVNGYTI
jgi:hypothetical protein